MTRVAAIAFAAALSLAACAVQPPAPVGLIDVATLERNVSVGSSTTQQVQAALGPATIVRFDSGYEVWLYRYRPARPMPAEANGEAAYAEFVILFGPDGVAAKIRRREPSATL